MKKNVASQITGAQMVSATDGSAFTGTATVVVTIDGGTQSASGGTGPTHEGNGFHSYVPTQAETNGDHVAFTYTGSGAVPVTVQIYTTFPQTGDNFARLGAPSGASVSADILTVAERLPTTLVSGRIVADVYAISGDAPAADNAESFFDGTGYAGTGNTIPTVTTLTGHTPQTGDAYALTNSRLPAALVDGKMDSITERVLVHTTILAYTAGNDFTLSAGSSDNNAYNGALCIIRDQVTAAQKAQGVVNIYTGATRRVQLVIDPGIFTFATGDFVTIIADRSLKATTPTRRLAVDSNGRADVSLIEGVDATDQIDSRIAAAGLATAASISALNNLSAAQVNAEVDTAITDASLATAASISALNNLSAAQVNAEVDTAITDAFSFGVTGKVDANVTHVNEIEVTGDGGTGTEWGPV